MSDRQTDVSRKHVRDRNGDELLFNRALGTALRDRRNLAGWTQEQLALQAGMTRGSIANIERGEQVPGLYRLNVIAAALGCNLTDLVPQEAFTATEVADSINDRLLSAVSAVKRQAKRESAKATS